ncbi:hypothetical protein [Streptomyces collinus]|uniref:hypothetical protein n=1 Tax=Streptomyces collinus TaxID=42684 RepID=UPI002942E6AB|nr:hypothetical protein [Streptomyces collinus]
MSSDIARPPRAVDGERSFTLIAVGAAGMATLASCGAPSEEFAQVDDCAFLYQAKDR